MSGFFFGARLPISLPHQSCCTLYLFGFSEKENPKRMPLHQGDATIHEYLRPAAQRHLYISKPKPQNAPQITDQPAHAQFIKK